jgi:chemotaxis protein methyltransferase CheR
VTARVSVEPERFRGWIARRLGLHFDDTKLAFLADVLCRRADEQGLPPELYLERLEVFESHPELTALVSALTVPETYFFRHIEQFNAFADVVLPNARSLCRSFRKISVLSAGCASGEEPYSLAILAREQGADFAGNVAIRAVDANPVMLAKARRACYSAWALRETPPDLRRRWFRPVGREFALEDSFRSAVTFQETNLAQENAELWAVPSCYDVIFCRNVLMYFTQESAQALVDRLTRSLVPGGYLFLGHAETLRGLSQDYHLRHTHGAFYYQRKDAPLHAPVATHRGLGSISSPGEVPVAEAPSTGTWMETIQLASQRIQTLVARPVAESGGRGEIQTGTQLHLVLEFLKNERFADALGLLERLPPESVADPDVLLLRAVLHTHNGQLEEAEKVCGQLLERDGSNTGAHYLLALCRESAGDALGALDHDRVAIYLDPGFAMPRLHLGLLARRAGDRESARHELGQALLLLEREDASRLLLFGGGFGREALIALCRAELLSAGGIP